MEGALELADIIACTTALLIILALHRQPDAVQVDWEQGAVAEAVVPDHVLSPARQEHAGPDRVEDVALDQPARLQGVEVDAVDRRFLGHPAFR